MRDKNYKAKKLEYIEQNLSNLQELAGTITTSVASLEPTEIIRGSIEKSARANLVAMQRVRVNRDLIGSPARSLIVGGRGTISVASVSEGSAITKVNPTWTPHTLTPTKYGVGVRITREALDAFHFDLIDSWLEEAGYAMATKLDDVVLEEIRTASGVGSTDATTSGVLSYDDAISARTTIRGNNYNPDTLIIHSDQEGDLVKDTKFINASAYGDREPILNGHIGKFGGMEVLVTTQCPSGTAIAFDSKKACTVALKRDYTVRREDKPEYDSVDMYVTKMIDPAVVNTGAVCVIHGC